MTRDKRLSLAALLLSFLLLFAACGGDDGGGDDDVASLDDSGSEDTSDDDDGGGGGGDGPSEEERAEMEDAMLEYVQCMRDEGIDMPDPEFDDNGGGITMEGPAPGSEDEMQAAEEKCSPILEESAPNRDMSPEEKAELQDQLLEMAQCMRDRGHEMEDPVVDDNGGVMIGGGLGDPATGPEPGSAEDEQFRKDMDECNDEAGLEGGPGGGGNSDDEEGSDT